MKLSNVPFHTTDWATVPATEHPGEHGSATWRTITCDDARVRIVEYSPGYIADHWCERGHIVFVLEGEIVTELKDGRSFVLRAGHSYQVATGDGSHRTRTSVGARLFIVD